MFSTVIDQGVKYYQSISIDYANSTSGYLGRKQKGRNRPNFYTLGAHNLREKRGIANLWK